MAAATQTPAGDSAVILIVDDDLRNVEALGEFLQAAGYRTVGAPDGESALEEVQRVRPDLVLLDILMPGLDGFEVCRRLKEDPSTVFLPVVLVTGLNSPKDRIKGVEAGADDFLTKPINSLELVTRVKSLLRVKRLHDELEAQRRELERRVEERTGQLRRALEELHDLDRLKSEFVSRMSHELRTPLIHVKGYLTLAQEGALGPQMNERRRGLASAVRSALQLEQLVDDIVDLGRANIGPLEIRPVSAAEAVLEAVVMVEQAHAPQPLNIVTEAPKTLPPVLADAGALARCLRHLLDNAVKFGPPGYPVEVRAELAAGGERLRFSVRDQGAGIPPGELEKVFRGFHQVDGSATRRHGGAGVGLALVKLLLEAQGAAIGVENAEGQGACFYFELPVADSG